MYVTGNMAWGVGNAGIDRQKEAHVALDAPADQDGRLWVQPHALRDHHASVGQVGKVIPHCDNEGHNKAGGSFTR
jgi:hypothetical protein